MSATKKAIRAAFRDAVFKRDKNACKKCGVKASETLQLDAHHVTDRTLMPNGGYVLQNGTSLCPECHERAEMYHSTGEAEPEYMPDELYGLIFSSYEAAVKASEKLK